MDKIMIHLTADTDILLATQSADFRHKINDIGVLFVFINRKKP